jgi:hypothetical protein
MMQHDGQVVSHFWVAAPPFFSSTILVGAPGCSDPTESIAVQGELFDVEGLLIRTFGVEFPAKEVGIIELEPFMTGLKMQGGIAQGHLVLTSAAGTRHFCRQQVGGYVSVLSEPFATKGREMTCMPLLLGARREHLLMCVNTTREPGQVVVRLLYGTRSPEWTVQLPAYGCRAVSLEHELLSTFDDATWQKGVVQGYVRISPKAHSEVVCHILERSPSDNEDQESYRCLSSW